MKVPLGQCSITQLAPKWLRQNILQLLLCNSSLTITQNVLSSFHVFFTVTSKRRLVKVLNSNLLSSIIKSTFRGSSVISCLACLIPGASVQLCEILSHSHVSTRYLPKVRGQLNGLEHVKRHADPALASHSVASLPEIL